MTTIWHTDSLTQFNHLLYHDLLTRENIVSDEQNKKYEGEDYFGYTLEKINHETKLKDKFYVRTDDISKLPLKILQATKFSYKNEVLKMVNKAETRRIPSRKDMNPIELVNFYASYKHSQPQKWLLARKIILACYIERCNIRIVSPASFGKDALVDILDILNGGVSNLYNATLAKLKYSLNNNLIVINELGGLKKEDMFNLQTYLTQAGAYKPKYENNSRAREGVKESMDLINRSHVIFHNTPDYYISKEQQYFEQMFTPAIMDRFPALLFSGWVEEDFSSSKKIEEYSPQDIIQLKKFISSLNFYRDNTLNIKPTWVVPDDYWQFKGKEMQRSLRSFKILSKWLSLFANTEEEFKNDCYLMNRCRLDYRAMLKHCNGMSNTIVSYDNIME